MKIFCEECGREIYEADGTWLYESEVKIIDDSESEGGYDSQ